MSDPNAPDPSGPQWTTAWEYQAGGAVEKLRNEGQWPPAGGTGPSAEDLRRKRRKRSISAAILGMFAVIFLVGSLYDQLKGKHGDAVGILVLGCVCGVFAGISAWKALNTAVPPDPFAGSS